MYCYNNVIGTLPGFLIFVNCYCLFVCFTFFKGIDGGFSSPLTALITEIVHVNNEKDPKPIMLCGCFVMSRFFPVCFDNIDSLGISGFLIFNSFQVWYQCSQITYYENTNTVEPPCAITCRKRPPSVSDRVSVGLSSSLKTFHCF